MLKELAILVHDQVYKRFINYKTTLFLCGAGKKTNNKDTVRELISNGLTAPWYSAHYDVFYPEDLFDDLLYGPTHQDLITLENILAESVDAVVLIVESYGAVAELGSFASNPNLRKKLICVVNTKFKKDKSFINYGPLRLIRDTHEGLIIYIDYDNVSEHIDDIRWAISKIRRGVKKSVDVTNVVQAHHYILPCIYLLEPVARNTLVELVHHASGKDLQVSSALTSGALSILNKNRQVALTPDGYRLTEAGMNRFSKLGKRGRTKHTFNLSALDRMRIAVLNWSLRGKRLQF